MRFFGWIFWLVPLFFMMMVMRRRRWERGPARPAGDDRELGEQRAYIEALESRVSQLEERLDFTERLLATRPPAAAEIVGAGPGPAPPR